MDYKKAIETIKEVREENIENKTLEIGVKQDIEYQYEKSRNEIAKTDEFKKLSNEIANREAKAQFGKDMLSVMTKEHQNELSLYQLKCEKEKFAFKMKKEKKIIAEEVCAEVQERKMNALKKRYGYLYKENEQFIANKSYNRYREIVNWYDGTSNTFKKFVKSSLKVILWLGIASLVILIGYRAFKWISQNTANLPPIK